MDWQPEKPDGDRDYLDRLLGEARWAEPTPEAIGRLEGHWRRLMVRRTRRRRLAWMLMAASILLAAVGLSSWLRSGPATEQRAPIDIARKNIATSPPQPIWQPVQVAKQHPGSSLVQKHAPDRPSVALASRPPNVYESFVMVAHRRMRESQMRRAEPPPAEPPVERAPEQPVVDQQAAALRQELSSLLARNDLQSVRTFLDRVQDQRTSAAALNCLASAANPPVELLFRCLRGPTASQRTAAALALGRLNQPAVSCRLIAMIQQGIYRQGAMIALLSSSEPIARQFLADAERNQMLAASLWNAKRQLQNPFTWRS